MFLVDKKGRPVVPDDGGESPPPKRRLPPPGRLVLFLGLLLIGAIAILAGLKFSGAAFNDNKTNTSTLATSSDITPPSTPTPTLSNAAGNTFIYGSIVFLNPQTSRSGSFTVTTSPSDEESGIDKVNFPLLADFTSGGGDDNSSPYTTNYSWSGVVSASGSQTITAYNGSGLTATDTFTVTPDTAAPTGGVLTVNGTQSSSVSEPVVGDSDGSFTVSRTSFSDATSGVASSQLQRQTATLTDNGCGSYGTATTLAGSPAESGLASGCYKYTLSGTDNVGNTSAVRTLIVKVDTTPPATPTLTFSNFSGDLFISGSTVFYNGALGKSGSFDLAADSSDSDTTLTSLTFPTLAGFSGGGVIATAPYSTSYSFSGAALATGLQSIFATNGIATNSANAEMTLTSDTTAPTAPTLTPSNASGNTYISGSTIYLNNQATNSGSFTVTGTTTEAGSGVKRFTFSGGLSGYSSPTTNQNITAAPYSQTYSWSGAAATSGLNVTATDNVNNTSSSSAATIVSDTAAPSGGALTVNGSAASAGSTSSYNTSGSFTIGTRTDYTDSGSGLASSTLTREDGTLSGNTCSAYGAPQTLTGAPAQSSLTTGCYRYRLTGTDNVGNATSVTTLVRVDTTGPTSPAATLSNASGASTFVSTSYNSGKVVYINNQAGRSGSFDVTATSSDADSLLQSITFPGLSGWTPATNQTDSSSPYSQTYSWSGAVAGAGDKTVTATNRAGGTTANSAAFTIVSDQSVPTAGALTVNGAAAAAVETTSYNNSGSFTIGTRTDYTETQGAAQSGLASSTLTRESGTLSGDSCSAYGAPQTLTGSPSQSSLSTGCYRYTLTGTDNVGNATSITTTVKVDTSATTPDAPTFSAVTGSTYVTGTTVYVNNQANKSGGFTVNQTSTVPSGVASVVFPGLTGWTPSTNQTDSTSPFSQAYAWSGAVTAPGSQTITVNSKAGSANNTSFTITSDTTAPINGKLTINSSDSTTGAGTTIYSSTGSFSLTKTNFTDAGSGLSGTANRVTKSTASLAGDSCGVFSVADSNFTASSETSLASGCYKYELNADDNVGNAASTQTIIVKADTSVPTQPTLTLSDTDSKVFTTGTTAYINDNTSNTGSFTVAAASTDNDSTIASYAFPTTGFTSGGGTVTFPSNSTVYNWTAGTVGLTGSRSITATNKAGGVSSGTSFTVTSDQTAPTGGALSASAYSTSGTFNVSVTAYTETQNATQSGLASSILTRQTGTLSGDVCSAYGGATDVTASVSAGSLAQTGLAAGCYLYTLTGTDNVGNTATVTTTVKVDTTAPLSPSPTLSNATGDAFVSGTTAFINNQASRSGTFDVAATSSDNESTLASITFPGITGWTQPTTDQVDSSSPYSQTYSFSGAVTGTGSKTLTATNKAGGTATNTFTITSDTTAPTAPTLTPSAATGTSTFISGSTIYIDNEAGKFGGFTLTGTTTESGSGVKQFTFGGLSGYTPSTNQTDTSSPYSQAYTWSGAVGVSGLNVTATDNVNNTSSATAATLVSDTTAPTGGALTVNGTAASAGGTTSYSTSTSVTIGTRTDYTETQSGSASGLASSTLTRQSATLSGDVCGTFATNAGDGTLTGTPAQTLTTGNCYQYTLIGTDNVGNQTSISTTVKVDTTAPSSPSPTVSSATGVSTFISGSNVFINNQTGRSGGFTVSATSADSESGIASLTFPGITGLTPSTNQVDTSSPYSQAYTWADTATGLSSGTQRTITATNNASSTTSNTSAFTVTSDTTAPAGGKITVATTDSSTGGTTVYSNTGSYSTTIINNSDAGSGIASGNTVTKESAPLTGDSCGSTWTPVSSNYNAASETGLTTNCYRYTLVTTTDNVGNSTVPQVITVKVDTTVPTTPSLTVSGATGGSTFISGSTVYIDNEAGKSGSFSVSATSSDSETSIASITFPGITGWTPATNQADTSSPYSQTYSWSNTASAPGSLNVFSTNNASANSANANFTVTSDTAAPSGGKLTINSTDSTAPTGPSIYDTDGSFAVAKTNFADSGAGLTASSNQITKESTTFSNNACGTSWTTVSTNYTTTPETGLADGCYRYTLTATDNVGNSTSSEITVRVDTANLPAPTVSLSNASGDTFISGTTAFVNNQAGRSGGFDASATATAPASGIASFSFPGITGWTPATDQSDTSSPYSQSYSWSGAVSAPGSRNITYSSNAGGASGPGSFTVTSDTTAPTAPTLTPSAATGSSTFISGSTVYIDNEAGKSGGFTLTGTTTESGSGVKRFDFGAGSSGWTPATGQTTTNSPYNQVYSWTGTASTTGPSVTATDNVNNTSSSSTFSGLVSDTTAPTGGKLTISANDSSTGGTTMYNSTGSYTVSRVNFSDSGSGMASQGSVTKETATLLGDTCGTFSTPPSVYTPGAETVTTGCYRYTISPASGSALDNVGNSAPAQTIIVKVDTSVPPAPTLTLSDSDSRVFTTGTTAYINDNTSNTGSFTVQAASTDSESGTSSYTFPTTGFTSGGGTVNVGTINTAGSTTYNWTAGAANLTNNTGRSVTATNKAGGVSSATAFTVISDTAGPTGGALSINGTAATGGGATLSNDATTGTISRTDFTDAGSGIASSNLKRETATLTGTTCGAFTTSHTNYTSASDSYTAGNCYQYTLSGSDNVGNAATSLIITVKVFAKGVTASGGTISNITQNGVNYRVHTFNSSSSLSVNFASSGAETEYLVVGGGGAGGTGSGNMQGDTEASGAGGGAGGMVEGLTTVSSGTYTITIGAGGAINPNSFSNGGNGGNSSFASVATAIGGGGGGWGGMVTYPIGTGSNGNTGGSGGGAGAWSNQSTITRTGGSGTAGQGNRGGNASPNMGYQVAAGGGGAGAAGGDVGGGQYAGGNGGAGRASSISGTSVTYAGGGGGAGNPEGFGGLGGGGNGENKNNYSATPGAPNTGGGGGGGHPSLVQPGGSGVVIVRYPTSVPVNTAVPTVTSAVSGKFNVGVQLTASTGTWAGTPTSPSYTYQWQSSSNGGSSWSNIAGATSSTYAPVAGDTGNIIRVQVTTSNAVGPATASSSATTAVSNQPIVASGGTETTITQNGVNYTVHTFTSSSSLNIGRAANSAETEYLVVGGGGGGGGTIAGGGGGGGFLSGSASLTAGNNYAVTVGSGGTGALGWNNSPAQGGSGGNSSLSGTGLTTITATGGGGGGSYGCGVDTRGPLTGGSGGGGGSCANTTGAAGTTNQGFAGGNGSGNSNTAGGGGGAGGAGTSATASVSGAGGAGKSSSITGTATLYGGGGGGGVRNGSGTVGAAGSGGGGVGNALDNAVAASNVDGTNSLGGGGGGCGHNGGSANRCGGNGGSGIVIVRYPASVPNNTTAPTISGLTSVGSALIVNEGVWEGSRATPTYAYQWQRSADGGASWTNISGATSRTYTLTSSDANQVVRAQVTSTNAVGTSSAANSAASGTVVNPAVSANGGNVNTITQNGVSYRTHTFTRCSAANPDCSYTNRIIADSPAGFWMLNEASGTSIADSSGNARNGTLSGTATYRTVGPTRLGTSYGMGFNGTTTRVSTATNSAFNSQNNVSDEAWFKSSSTSTTQTIIRRGNMHFLLLDGSSGRANFWAVVNNSWQILSSNATGLNDGQWHHVVGTYDGTHMRIYIDGNLSGIQRASGGLTLETGSGIDIGTAQSGAWPFQGELAHVATYSSTLSETQVSNHWLSGSNTFQAASVQAGAEVEYLVVGGGGGGGLSGVNQHTSGGGGAGGVLCSAMAVTTGSYATTVGAGGNAGTSLAAGTQGGNSAFGAVSATGGGGGASGGGNYPATTGGSGGGGGVNGGSFLNGQAGTAGQGNSGGNAAGTQPYYGGGGGGASAAGQLGQVATTKGGNGGAGTTCLSYTVGGGGGGSGGIGGTAGSGGSGGGGTSGVSIAASSGTDNTGGGGGGGPTAGNGGSGIVVVRYPITPPNNSVAPVISGNNTVIGSVLTTTNGTWFGESSTPSRTYQWQSSPDGSTWSNIAGATSSTYTLAPGDAGNRIRVRVSSSNGSGSATASSNTLVIDSTAPSSPTVTLSGATGSSTFIDNTNKIVYIDNEAGKSGSFTVAASATDAESGITSYTFPTINGFAPTSGSGNGGTVNTPSNSTTYSWLDAASGLSSGSVRTVTATNGAGLTNSNNMAFTVTSDLTAPTGGALTVNGQAASAAGSSSVSETTSFNITARTDYSETQNATNSGLASSTLTRQSADYLNYSCGSFSTGSGDGTIAVAGLPISQGSGQGIVSGKCYRYTLTGVDNTGNSTSVSTTVQVETTSAPANTLSPSFTGTLAAGNTLTASPGSWNFSPAAYSYQWQGQPQFTAVSAGQNHSCGILANGSVWCWGSNSTGQLGNNSTTQSLVPVQVSGIDGSAGNFATAISAGSSHSCAVVSGAARCWGANNSGQLGDNSTNQSLVPVQVYNLGGVTAISAGGSHSCAIVNGGARCWGDNYYGQIGDNSTTNPDTGLNQSLVPVQVSGLTSGVTAISAGSYHSCAVVSGAARCWGYNNSGQLGDNSTTQGNVPVQVSGLTSGVTAISAGGYHSCAVVSGAARCWGWNSSGQLGNNSTTQSNVPVTVSGLTSGVTAISAGYHSCAVVSGAARCWGANNSGQLGNNSTTQSLVPVQVSGLTSGVTAISAGNAHSCAVASIGQCWGSNGNGQLGNNSAAPSIVPVTTINNASWINFGSASSSNTLALTSTHFNYLMRVQVTATNANGSTSAFSAASSSTIGTAPANTAAPTISGSVVGGSTLTVSDGSWTGTPPPSLARQWYRCTSTYSAQATVGANCTLISGATGSSYTTTPTDVGAYITAAVTATNTVGSATFLAATTAVITGSGPPSNSSAPSFTGTLASGSTLTASTGSWNFSPTSYTYQWQGLPQFTAVSAGQNHSCGILANGSVWCWGSNSNGQLGNNSTTQSVTPVQVSGIDGSAGNVATAISAGNGYSCAVVSGAARCWGDNLNGQLGNNSTTQSLVPVQVSGLTSGVTAISAGLSHSCAVVNGAAQCWGANGQGRLGNNSTAQSNVPVQVSGLTSGVTAISAGGNHSCAVVSGAARCWGWNSYGQLGDNSINDSAIPVAASGLTSGVTAISAGNVHSCAVVSGAARCWGDNGNGQLGNNSTTQSNVPVQVSGLTSGVTAISVGASPHSCAVVNGAAQCWGANNSGQLGNNSTTQSNVPVQVSGLTSGATAIAAGSNQSCAVVSGAARCWGYNFFGQLGNNLTTQSLVPVTTVNNASWTNFGSASSSNTLALTSTHVNYLMRVQVTATNANGSTSANSAASSSIIVTAPANTAAPTISGSILGGSTLTVSDGSWTGTPTPSLARQWYRCTSTYPAQATVGANCIPIAGATGSTYQTRTGDGGNYITAAVRATSGASTTTFLAATTSMIDFTAPSSPTVTLSGATGSSTFVDNTNKIVYIDNEAGKSGSFTVAASATDAESGITSYTFPTITGFAPTSGSGNGATVNFPSNSTTYSWLDTASGSTGAKTVTATNGVGLTNSNNMAFTVTSDLTAPTGGALTVNGQAASAAGSSSVSDTTSFNITARSDYAETQNATNSGLASSTLTRQSADYLNYSCGSFSTGSGDGTIAVAGLPISQGSGQGIVSGKCYRYTLTGVDNTGNSTSVSTTVQVETTSAPVNTLSPSFTGTLAAGNTLTASPGSWNFSPAAYSYQWQGQPQFTSVSTGGSHSCGILANGSVWCWGLNSNGQLGNNSTTQSLTPVQVSGIDGSAGNVATAIGAGSGWSCAVVSGAARCWGTNGNGQLGNNSITQSNVPVQVSGLTSGVTAISAGNAHSCAVVNGAAQCWGWNGNGQLGNNSTTQSLIPVQVSGLTSGVTAISTGHAHSCAVVNGAAQCWGSNAAGRLGNNSITQSLVPVQVSGLTSGVTAISAGGSHTCAVVSGAARCWGTGSSGQLGDNLGTQSLVPVSVSGLTSGVTAISTGSSHSCAVVSAAALCWGNGTSGQLGDNLATQSLIPVQVSGLTSGVTAISTTGGNSSCAVTNSISLCWGSNGNGQLGNNSTTQSNIPVTTTNNASWTNFGSASSSNTLALTSTHINYLMRVQVTATNANGSTSAFSAASSSIVGTAPTNSSAPTISGSVVGGSTLTLSDGSWTGSPAPTLARQWYRCTSTYSAQATVGANCTLISGATGSSYTTTPTDVGAYITAAVTATSTAGSATFLAATTAIITGSGPPSNSSAPSFTGTLASGSTLTASTGSWNFSPTSYTYQWQGQPQFTAVAAGQSHSCGILANGSVWCWGLNSSGQLGNNSTTQSLTPVQVSGIDGSAGNVATAISAGDSHSCAVVSGAARCWGANGNGRLGNNSTTQSNIPVTVSGLTSGVTAISAGGSHSCAVINGAAQCWGNNGSGRLGNNSTTQSNVPVQVSGLTSGVTAISAGLSHSCAVVNGAAQCWGFNGNGQLGNNSTTQSLVPVQVSGLTSGVTAISTGASHSCAVVNGAAQCWGQGSSGQLGNNSITQSNVPVQVSGLTSGVTAIAAGSSQSCAVVNGAAQCWGNNGSGQLGNNSIPQSLVPVQVSGLTSGVTAISAGNVHSCAVANSTSQCWGDNTNGQLGNNSTTQSNIPVTTTNNASWTNFGSASSSNTLALTSTHVNYLMRVQVTATNANGSTSAFSAASSSIIGTAPANTAAPTISGSVVGGSTLTVSDGSWTGTPPPSLARQWYRCTSTYSAQATVGANCTLISGATGSSYTTTPTDVGAYITAAVTATSTAGSATFLAATTAVITGSGPPSNSSAPSFTGTLASGSTLTASTGSWNFSPTSYTYQWQGLPQFTAVAAGQSHSCGILANGSVWCWGLNSSGQLGNNSTTQSLTPVQVSGIDGSAGNVATAISAGDSHSCAVVSGAARCWGANGNGRLGNNSTTQSLVPVQVSGLTSGVTAISAGGSHSCAVINGAAQCWGANTNGQLGNNSTTQSLVPVQVSGLTSGVTAISAGNVHSCAIVSGAARCWGNNTSGQLGNNSTTQSLVPVNVSGIDNTAGNVATAISAGNGYSCAIVSGAARCWGSNTNGQLGNNSTTQSLVPVQVSGLTSGVTAISVGTSPHSCAVVNGAAQCWGANGNGQLGNNSTTQSLVPVQVSGLTSGATAIAAGSSQSCAVVNGTARCWGTGSSGQLGNNSTTQSNIPVTTTNNASWTNFGSASSSNTLALTSTHVNYLMRVQVTATNANGSTSANSAASSAIIVTAPANTAAPTISGSVVGGSTLTLSDGSWTGTPTPSLSRQWYRCSSSYAAQATVGANCTPIAGATGSTYQTRTGDVGNYVTAAVRATSGASTTTFLAATTAVITGIQPANASPPTFSGTLQSGNILTASTGIWNWSPTSYTYQWQGLPQFTAVSTGQSHSCGILANGSVWCWGLNGSGQLGNNSTTQSLVPVQVSGIDGSAGNVATAISAGNSWSCAVVSGAARCWGNNGNGQLGNNSIAQSNIPVTVSGLTSGVTAISVSNQMSHSCAVVSGAAQCWGGNNSGQLGNNSSTDSLVPVQVSGLTSGVTAVSAGQNHSCAVVSGAARCWGWNGNGRLGDNSTTQSLVPVQVSGLTSGVTAISAGLFHSCAVVSGAAQCWGQGGSGQLGNNSSTQSLVPVTVSGLTSGVTSISAGSFYSCAVTSGSARCWGDNSSGQLGNNSTTQSLVPVTVSGLTSGVTAISAGNAHSCAIASIGQCWGDNSSGQLGNNSTTQSNIPVTTTNNASWANFGSASSSNTLALTSTHVGYLMRVQVTATNANGSNSANSEASTNPVQP